jgi:hypothetical protein
VRSRATPRFWEAYNALPDAPKQRARVAYGRFQQDAKHPSLRFKRVHETEPIYSVRVTRDCRALGVLEGGEVVWFWIGSHADYDRLLTSL